MADIKDLPSIRQVVEQYQLNAKKSLGQNFIFDPNITDRVAAGAVLTPKDTVLEIGPGPGGLTRSILKKGCNKLTVIERDHRCIEALKDLERHYPGKLFITEEDALKVKLKDIVPSGEKIKIVANLPYNIGTVLLLNWFDEIDLIESMTLMFQKEVALRLSAKPRTKDYGRLSVIVQYFCKVQNLFDLPPSVFFPPPKIVSTVVHLVPKAFDEKLKQSLFTITQKAFANRRKMLRSNLKGVFSKEELEGVGIQETQRAEELSVEEFLSLARLKVI